MAKKFPWGCVLGGCAATIVVVIVAVGVGGYFTYKKAKQFGESIKDPDKRAEKVMDVLGAETLPDGMYPGFAFSIPFVMDMAFLVDNPPKKGGAPGEMDKRGLIYISIRGGGHQQRELERFFEGKANDAEVLRQNNVKLDLDRLVGRGSIDSEDGPIRWVSYIGTMADHHNHGSSLITMLQADCGDSRMHLGIWLRPVSELPAGMAPSSTQEPATPPGGEPGAERTEPEPEQKAGTAEASPEALKAFEAGISEFAGHFRFCSS
jgi:hypothetical protein